MLSKRTMAGSGRGRGKKTFRDGSYYAHVLVGKRTVKQGEAAAIWGASGKRIVITGPSRTRLWFSHVRFLDRFVADTSEYLLVQHRDGRKEHIRGPIAMFFDPCVHEKVEVKPAYKLAANEALVVYQEESVLANVIEPDRGAGTAAASTPLVAKKQPAPTTLAANGVLGSVCRRIVRGPAVYIPDPNEWVHSFSWHGSVTNGKGSQTGQAGDEKKPHALNFCKLRQMPDQMYYSVRDVRTSDDAQITIHLMLFYELVDIECMLENTNDPIGDFINATSADVMSFGATNTYAKLLENTNQLSAIASFPTVSTRMAEVGYKLLDVVYRGYSTSPQLQAMHDEAIAKRTKLRLQSDTAEVEQAEQAMQLRCRQERSAQEQSLAEETARHKMELLKLEAGQKRAERDADHAQALRHEQEGAAATLRLKQAENEEELRRLGAMGKLGVDLTKYLIAASAPLPDQHVRVDSAVPTHVHLDTAEKRKN